MPRAVFVTSHYLDSRRKAGFHWLADALWRSGWDVLFFTESISWLSWLKGDIRFDYPLWSEANRLKSVRDRLTSYVWLTPFHPINLRRDFLNRRTGRIMAQYGRLPIRSGVLERITAADLIVFDSDHGLFLTERFRKRNRRARFVYRVSDDLPMMGHHPEVLRTEQRVAPIFDLISTPTEYIFRKFAARSTAKLHPHGLNKAVFDAEYPSPFRGPGPHAVFVGRRYLDADTLARSARLFPDWTFHIFGGADIGPAPSNVVAYGERPFAETVPYLKHADVGLQMLSYTPGAECLTDSLKMQQYTYCRLPIVASEFLKHSRSHVCYYRPGDDVSIREAFLQARAFDRAQVSRGDVRSWDEVSELILDASGFNRD